jgi:sirohydrochlorin ferrochelatase
MTTALLLIAHGSRQAEANADLFHLAEELRKRGHSVVVPSFLELAAPGIEEGGRLCVAAGVGRVVLVPCFLSAGTHVRRDLTAARDNLASEFPGVEFLLAEPIGRHPLLVEVISQRTEETLLSSGEKTIENATPGVADPVQHAPASLPESQPLDE